MHGRLIGKSGLVLVAFFALVATGCGSFVRAHGVGPQIDVRMHAGLSEVSTEVHLVGVSEEEYQKWAHYSMSRYFSPGDPLYESATDLGYAYVMAFGRGHTDLQRPWRESRELWRRVRRRWRQRQARYVFVLANLPGFPDRPGKQDPRRLILKGPWPWWSLFWPKALHVLVTEGGLMKTTAPSAD